MVWDKFTIFRYLVGHQKPSNDVFSDVVAHDLELFFEGQRFESRQFRLIKRGYLTKSDRYGKYYYSNA